MAKTRGTVNLSEHSECGQMTIDGMVLTGVKTDRWGYRNEQYKWVQHDEAGHSFYIADDGGLLPRGIIR